MLPWIVAAVLLVCVSVLTFKLWSRRKPSEVECKNCKHWDHESGQAALRRSSTFAHVMQVLTPNDEFGKKVYEEYDDLDETTGEVTKRKMAKRLPVWPTLENRWEYFGGCKKDDAVRHRTDKCEKFEAV